MNTVYVYECPDNYYKCPGNYCIPLSYLCDGQWHCADGEDERQCGELLYNPLAIEDLKFYQSQGLSTFWGLFIFVIEPVFHLAL